MGTGKIAAAAAIQAVLDQTLVAWDQSAWDQWTPAAWDQWTPVVTLATSQTIYSTSQVSNLTPAAWVQWTPVVTLATSQTIYLTSQVSILTLILIVTLASQAFGLPVCQLIQNLLMTTPHHLDSLFK